MKKIFFSAIIIFFVCCSKKHIEGLPTLNSDLGNFVKTLGGSKNDVFQSVVKTSDGGYAILGYTQSNDFDIINKTNESFDFWVIKFSSEDNLEWQKTLGGTDDDRGYDIIATNDGGLGLFGFSKSADIEVSQNSGAQDFWLLKLTSKGIISWEKSYGFIGADNGTTFVQTSDNGYLITGVLDVTASNGDGNSKTTQKHAGGDVWAIKTNSSGDLEWSRYFGGSFTDTPFGIVETPENDFIIAASSDSDDFNISNNKGTYDFWVLKISNEGVLIWENNFGGSEIDEPRGISSTNDGNFVIVGDTRSSDQDVTINNGGADLWLLKISTDGNLIWEKSFGGTSFDVARSISKTQDNGFLISGYSRSTNNNFTNQGQSDAWILKVDSSGEKLWQKIIGGSENDFLFDAIELNNQSIIAVGESSSSDFDIIENKGFSDALIIKTR